MEVSSSSWGCELKNLSEWTARITGLVILFMRMWVEKSRYTLRTAASTVILFMRMWVEKLFPRLLPMRSPSSSSWGCEVKSYRLYSALYCVPVILFMRMWVEKNGILAAYYGNFGHPPCEDVSWKTSHNTRIQTYNCHPPCEDVSWKVQTKIRFHTFRASSSLWGCELK